MEEVEYEIDGKKVRFGIRVVKYGEWQKVMDSSGSGMIEMLGSITKGKINTTKLAEELMKLAVTCVSTPARDFHDLDMVDGMNLQDRVLQLNGMGGEKKPFRADAT